MHFDTKKSLVIIVSLSQPTVELEQQFKKFLKDCIKMNLLIVYQRPAIYKKTRFFLVFSETQLTGLRFLLVWGKGITFDSHLKRRKGR